MNWSIESGHWHKCPLCNQRYSDSDGGCDCNYESCQECHKPFEAESDDKVFCPHCEAEMLAAAARDAESDMRLALMDQQNKEHTMKKITAIVLVVLASLALMNCSQSTGPVVEMPPEYYCSKGEITYYGSNFKGNVWVDSTGTQYITIPAEVEMPAETTIVYGEQRITACQD